MHRFLLATFLAGAALLQPGCAAEPCNGAAQLCDRRVDEVAFATTHNSMSNAEDGWELPNQNRNIGRQLADGIRGLMLDTHYDRDGVASLCHGPCSIGRRPLVEALREIGAFLRANPREVLLVQFEPYVSAADTAAAFGQAELAPLLHEQAPGRPWPTLRAMIESGRRLVVFAETDGGTPAWYHPLWDHAQETPWSFKTRAEMTCAPHRGRASNGLFLVNHFVADPLPDAGVAADLNGPFLLERVRACERERGRRANFVAVDFYDLGDVPRTVRVLNGL